MLTITMICNLGMSTSMLVDRMAEHAGKKGIEADIEARAFQRIEDRIHKTDILLIGPQVRHLAKKFEAEYGNEIPVIETMNMSDYALLKVDKIFDQSYGKFVEKSKN
jgi:PTS system cellobiose-specific IIB component